MRNFSEIIFGKMEKQLIEKNKLIAVFDGWELKENGVDYRKQISDTSSQTCYGGGFQYHSSWDWLMPVFFKYKKAMQQLKHYSADVFLSSLEQTFCVGICEEEEILTCHHALVEGIKWFNKNK